MTPTTTQRSPNERLVGAGVLNVFLLLVGRQFAFWSGVEHGSWQIITDIFLGALAFVWLFPVLRRGAAWQRVLGILLLLLPCLTLWPAFVFLRHS
jgi:hypothetical protein